MASLAVLHPALAYCHSEVSMLSATIACFMCSVLGHLRTTRLLKHSTFSSASTSSCQLSSVCLVSPREYLATSSVNVIIWLLV